MSISIPEESIPDSGSDAFTQTSTTTDTDGSGAFNVGGANMSAGAASTPWRYIAGLRFGPIPVPAKAIILSASMTMRAHSTQTGPWSLVIKAEDVDNPGIWTTNHRPGTGGAPGRGPETTAGVSWDPPDWITPTLYQTPDISTVVQELVDRAGWVFDNAMAFIIRNDGGPGLTRIIISTWDAPTSPVHNFKARFNITYTTGGKIVALNIV